MENSSVSIHSLDSSPCNRPSYHLPANKISSSSVSGQVRAAHYQMTPSSKSLMKKKEPEFTADNPQRRRKSKARMESLEDPMHRRKGKTSSKGGRFKSAPGGQRTSSLLSHGGGGLLDGEEARPPSRVSGASSVSSRPGSRHQCFKVSASGHGVSGVGVRMGWGVVQCCFTSTETIRTIRGEEPWTATSTFTAPDL